ncbi:tail fiber domain-containing protein (plasmid) [Xenorhabdus stockiae]|uniref:tail fiber domain-containing protein n=1 Tax=Xenorhabdus stockiae TaxID=351614 RepID=UPI003CF0D108
MSQVINEAAVLSSNRDALPLLADIQYLEPYTSSALNRKFKGILRAGIYTGFQPKAGTGLSVLITSSSEQDGQGAASINVGKNQISIQQVKEVIVPVPASKTSIIALEANFEFGKVTNQVDSASTIKAAHIVVVDVSQGISGNQLELCRVNVPMDAKAVTEAMIDTSHRVVQTVGITLSEKIDSDEENLAANAKAVNILRKTLLDNTNTRANDALTAANNANTNANGRVPSGRKVNGKPLSGDIALNSADVGAYSKGETDKHVNGAKALANAAQTAANNANNNANGRVPSGRTVNGKPLSGDIALNSADVGAYSKGETDKHVNDAKALANAAQTAANNANTNANGRVPSGRTVNGKPLSGDITLNAADVGAYSKGETDKHVNGAKALANAAQTAANNANTNANGRVPSGRKVNGKPLSGDIVLNFADVGAYSKGETYSRSEVDSRVNDIRNVAKTAQTAANNANNNANGRVPVGRKVNGKPLSSDIALSAADVGAYSKGETDKQINDAKAQANAAQIAANNANNDANNRVPSGRKVNGKPLSGDIVLTAADVGAYSKGETYNRTEIDNRVTDVRNVANAAQTAANNANNNANGRVPSGRKVNGKPLSGDIVLTATDVGAYRKGETYNRTEIDNRVTDVRNVANAAQTAANNANNNANGRVPSGRKVNDKPLSGDIILTAADVGAYSKGETYNRTEIDNRVTDVRSVANAAQTTANNANNNANGRVPSGRKVNGKALSADITLNAADIGAYSKGESDNKYQLKGNFANKGECYTKNESDGRYFSKSGGEISGNLMLTSAVRRHITFNNGANIDGYIYKDPNGHMMFNNGVYGGDWQMQIDGTFYCGGNGNFNDVYIRSDKRAKKDIEKICNASQKLSKLSGYTYTIYDDNNNSSRSAGLIAQQVQKVLPEAVTQDENNLLRLNYNSVIGLLVEAVKELKQEVAYLKKDLS